MRYVCAECMGTLFSTSKESCPDHVHSHDSFIALTREDNREFRKKEILRDVSITGCPTIALSKVKYKFVYLYPNTINLNKSQISAHRFYIGVHYDNII